VVLIGPPGAGKSAVGPLLADRLGVEFRDTDAEVGTAAGKPVGDIFIENGEEAFRELERSAATSALGVLREHGGVLALGSGAVLDAGIQALLEGLPVFYLSADFSTWPGGSAWTGPGSWSPVIRAAGCAPCLTSGT